MPVDRRVRVVVDSSTCLDPCLAAERGIAVVPMRLSLAGKDYRDLVDVSPAQVYRLLREGCSATTGSPSIGDYVAAFERSRGPVLCLTVSARISSMHDAAANAAEAARADEIEVVDSGTAAGGLRLLAQAAARLAAQGLTLPELTWRVKRLAKGARMAGMLESVEYLSRSGRVPQIASWGGNVLRLRPVVRFQDGKGGLAGVARSHRGGLRRLRAMLREDAARAGDAIAGTIFHGDAEDLARELKQAAQADLPQARFDLSEFTPAMGVHTGPGVVGYALLMEVA
jgi:DegV family protein with EDD domain